MKNGNGDMMQEVVQGFEESLGLDYSQREKLLADISSWGIQWNSHMRHGDHVCPRCMSFDPHSFADIQAIVGFSVECPSRGGDRPQAAGAIVNVCPHCHKYFWFHISSDQLRAYKKLCFNWGTNPMVI